ncbi:hypothetical protein CAEBREN_17656 [Caenorhabditis brenneri]|uniref:Sdz-33 F-box domain-containing protein n=1 Tax=Caenorhabditis brenneri TaxID=135651 RepID=G0MC94_CAEBE|nr:hypothetical protein CAEBREN_17656 [Caenorhabditis brenneri]
MKHKSILVVIDMHYIIIRFWPTSWLRFYEHETDEAKRLFGIPTRVLYTESTGAYNYTGEYIHHRMEMKEWVDHILDIRSRSEVDELTFARGCERYDFERVSNAIPKTRELTIEANIDEALSHRIFNQYSSHIDGLQLDRNIFRGNESKFRKLLIRNLHCLRMGWYLEELQGFGLNELLMCNTSYIKLQNINFSEKLLNRFLKLWVEGANFRMRRLNIYFAQQEVNKELILQGLGCRNIEITEQFTFNDITYTFNARNRLVAFFDFYRKDGVKGRIVFRTERNNEKEIFTLFT